jgi:hypothetical protein
MAMGLLVLSVGMLAGCGGSDLSTPKGAAKAFAVALQNGDAEGAKKASTGGDPKIIEGMANAASSMKKLRDAAVAKFGDEGKTFGGRKNADLDLAKNVDDATFKEEGDTATMTPKEGSPLKLKKVSGEWKVDVSEMAAGPMATMGAAMFDSMAKAAKTTGDEISAGKYKTAAEAKQAFDSNMMGSMMPKSPAP